MPWKNIGFVIFSFLVLMSALYGCSVESRHKTLTFFFDGVDDPQAKKVIVKVDTNAANTTAQVVAQKEEKKIQTYYHKPFENRECESCHRQDKSLKKPVPDLCFSCHKDFRSDYKYVHGPLNSGNCLVCHDQHMANLPKLLQRNGQKLCNICHAPSALFAANYHWDIEDLACTRCHSPHGGDNRRFLRGYYVSKTKEMEGVEQRHLYATVYLNKMGDLDTKNLKIQVWSKSGQMISTCTTDTSGRFQLLNIHPDMDYVLKLNMYKQLKKIVIENYRNEQVYTIEKGKNNLFEFDKAAYEKAHRDL